MANNSTPDVFLLLGVEGGGNIGKGSGELIATDLKKIMHDVEETITSHLKIKLDQNALNDLKTQINSTVTEALTSIKGTPVELSFSFDQKSIDAAFSKVKKEMKEQQLVFSSQPKEKKETGKSKTPTSTGNVSKEAAETKQEIKEVEKAAENVAHETEQVVKEVTTTIDDLINTTVEKIKKQFSGSVIALGRLDQLKENLSDSFSVEQINIFLNALEHIGTSQGIKQFVNVLADANKQEQTLLQTHEALKKVIADQYVQTNIPISKSTDTAANNLAMLSTFKRFVNSKPGWRKDGTEMTSVDYAAWLDKQGIDVYGNKEKGIVNSIENVRKALRGLSAAYQDVMNYTDTNDLDTISIKNYKAIKETIDATTVEIETSKPEFEKYNQLIKQAVDYLGIKPDGGLLNLTLHQLEDICDKFPELRQHLQDYISQIQGKFAAPELVESAEKIESTFEDIANASKPALNSTEKEINDIIKAEERAAEAGEKLRTSLSQKKEALVDSGVGPILTNRIIDNSDSSIDSFVPRAIKMFSPEQVSLLSEAVELIDDASAFGSLLRILKEADEEGKDLNDTIELIKESIKSLNIRNYETHQGMGLDDIYKSFSIDGNVSQAQSLNVIKQYANSRIRKSTDDFKKETKGLYKSTAEDLTNWLNDKGIDIYGQKLNGVLNTVEDIKAALQETSKVQDEALVSINGDSLSLDIPKIKEFVEESQTVLSLAQDIYTDTQNPELQQKSEAINNIFQQMQDSASTSLNTIEKEVEDVVEAEQELKDVQDQLEIKIPTLPGEDSVTSFARLSDAYDEFHNKMQGLGSEPALDNLGQDIEDVSEAFVEMGNSAEEAASKAEKLNKTTLNQINKLKAGFGEHKGEETDSYNEILKLQEAITTGNYVGTGFDNANDALARMNELIPVANRELKNLDKTARETAKNESDAQKKIEKAKEKEEKTFKKLEETLAKTDARVLILKNDLSNLSTSQFDASDNKDSLTQRITEVETLRSAIIEYVKITDKVEQEKFWAQKSIPGITNLTEAVDKLNTSLAATEAQMKKTQNDTSFIKDSAAISAIERYNKALRDFQNTEGASQRSDLFSLTYKDTNNLTMTKEQMESLVAETNRLTSATRELSEQHRREENVMIQRNKIYQEADNYYKKYQSGIKANITLNKRWLDLINKINTGGFGTDNESARRALAELQTATKEANAETMSLWGSLKKLFTDHFGSVSATAFIGTLRNVMRMAYQNVLDIDKAMTELKKVTNETESSYEKFMGTAADLATKVGGTISDTINSTADFARLGFSLEQSTALSEAAMVYKNVGDGLDDINEASESIISTIKAFSDIDAKDAMSIIDKFNEVGNNYAISSAGIGTALQKSAAALASANNSLDESIALITAGKQNCVTIWKHIERIHLTALIA